MNVPGLIVLIVLYILILIIGLWAGRRKNKSGNSDELFLANRELGLWIASFTTAASMVGGAYINGTAESMGRDGLVWTMAPVCYNVGMVIAGIFIAPKVRRLEYTTILDPFQDRYGSRMGAVLFIPELMGDLFWEAAILNALGSTLSIILGLNMVLSIIVSACVAVFYTFFGGLYAVAYTDVIQLFLLLTGLIIALPFSWLHEAVDLSRVSTSWVGHIPKNYIASYIDTILMVTLGATPWQAYYQRVLAVKTPSIARNCTIIAGIISMICAVPPALVGVVGSATDWNMTAYPGDIPLKSSDWTNVFPMSLEYLCPRPVAIIGIAAVSAAVMSSADSCVLATGSIFARNLYGKLIRPQASDKEMVWVLRAAIFVVGALGTIIAITVSSVYGLFILCSDLMYVVQFPQIITVLWYPRANTYGSLGGFLVGCFLRILGGEPLLKIPAVIEYPGYVQESNIQLFPFKSFAMLCSLLSIIVISFITDILFKGNYIPRRFDIFHCFEDFETKENNLDETDNELDVFVHKKTNMHSNDAEKRLFLEGKPDGEDAEIQT